VITPPDPFPGARLLFSLDPALAHLNHGSFGAVPIPVQRAQQRLRDEVEANPMAFYNRGLTDRIAHTRRHLATFLGADPEGTALIPNATHGVSVVLNSLRLRPGEEIVLLDHGYGAVLLAARRFAERAGAAVREIPIPLDADDDQIVAAVGGSIQPGRTRLAIVDQVTSMTARVMPVARLAAALSDTDVHLLVDAAHVPGCLAVDVTAIGADYWIGNFHKWAFAPRPTAVLTVAERHRAAIEPAIVSWQQSSGFPAAVEFGGTLDYTAWLAAPTGLFTLHSLGPAAVRAHNARLAEYGQQIVGAALGVSAGELISPGAEPVPMRIVPLPKGVATDMASSMALRARIAAELSCEVAVNVWRDQPLLRLSAQVYNRAEEYVRLAEGLPALLRTPGLRAA
jgi:isopenicillin-N epimerase